MAGWSLMNFYFLFHHLTILSTMNARNANRRELLQIMPATNLLVDH
jgi:hypothetical protein